MNTTNPIKQNKMLIVYNNIKISSDKSQQAQEATKELEYIIKAVQNVTTN